MNLPEFLKEAAYGEIQLKGHRINLEHVVELYRVGHSAEMICAQFPTLPLPLVHKIIAFYLENEADVTAYVTKCSSDVELQRKAATSGPGKEELRQRMELRKRIDAQQKAPAV